MNIAIPLAVLILGAVGLGLAVPIAMQYQEMQRGIADRMMGSWQHMARIHEMHHSMEQSSNNNMCMNEQHGHGRNGRGAGNHIRSEERVCEHMQERLRNRRRYMDWMNIWVNGTVEEIDPSGYLVIYTDNTSYTVIVHGLWITPDNETITYTELINSIEVGDDLSVLGHYCDHMETVRPVKIIVNGEEYTRYCCSNR